MIGTSAAMPLALPESSCPSQPGDGTRDLGRDAARRGGDLRITPRPYASPTTSTFDYPLTSRFDESDSLIVLDDVLIPWEHVFVHRDTGLVSAQFHETGAHLLANYQALVRFLVKMEFASGLAIELADAHGISAITPVQAQMGGDIAAFCSALDALVLGAGSARNCGVTSCCRRPGSSSRP
jgi:4-hydroxyphenylacetate 3-monooxygenase